MRRDSVLLLTPAGLPAPSMIVAADRAGAWGGYDLEWSTSVDSKSLKRLFDGTSVDSLLVKIDASSNTVLDGLLSVGIPYWKGAILAGGDATAAERAIPKLRQAGIEVFWEATTAAEIEAGLALGVDGLILKGNEAGGRVGEESAATLFSFWNKRPGSVSTPVWVQGGIGPELARAFIRAGARGVVIDDAILLTRESPLNALGRRRVRESRGASIVDVAGRRVRLLADKEGRLPERVREELSRIDATSVAPAEKWEILRETIERLTRDERCVMVAGSGAAMAACLGDRYASVAGVFDEYRRAIDAAGSPEVNQSRQRSARSILFRGAAGVNDGAVNVMAAGAPPSESFELRHCQSAEDVFACLSRGEKRLLLDAGSPIALTAVEQMLRPLVDQLGNAGRGDGLVVAVDIGAVDRTVATLVRSVLDPLAARDVEPAIVVAPGSESDLEELRSSFETLRETTAFTAAEIAMPPKPAKPSDVAIVGIACFYPKAAGLWTYWQNILERFNAVSEVPDLHWDWRLFYDKNPRARDKMVSKWGGFLDDILFDPLQFGVAPNSLSNIEPLQLMLLESVRQALEDAGYAHRPFCRERTSAILGIGGGGAPLAVLYGLRASAPMFEALPGINLAPGEMLKAAGERLPEWTEDSFPGILFNVAAGRVANRFDFGGTNYAIDAACASSLAAVNACVTELETGACDVAVAMGADTVQTPYAYVAFSKTHALSPRGQCRPFDASADGIVLSEGIGAIILKRLADAERDGDRVYAVIKGMGASSDGRAKGLTAPRAEGQRLALQRAYAKAGVDPREVALIEAHGTGTVVGDETESTTIGGFLAESGAEPSACAVGSVKSMIGHCKCAAGIAGLIKTTMALHTKTLPPTLVETPNPKGNFGSGPLYLNTQARPWVHGGPGPRRAGVSSFGFGGTNFHAVLSEYVAGATHEEVAAIRDWPAELVLVRQPTRAEVTRAAESLLDQLNGTKPASLTEIAWQAWRDASPRGGATLAIVATTRDDLKEKLVVALEILARAEERFVDPRGVYFDEKPKAPKVAFLYPGQGSQYPDMLAGLALAFPEIRGALDDADAALTGKLEKPLGRYIYPPTAFTPDQADAAVRDLTRTDIAQPAIGAVSLGLTRLIEALGVRPSMVAGHSFGEFTALAVAGAMNAGELPGLAYERGRLMRDAANGHAGGMISVEADGAAVAALLAGAEGLWIANHNAPTQTIVAGTDEGLAELLSRCQAKKLRAKRLPVATGFHSPIVAGAKPEFESVLSRFEWAPPRAPVYANTTATPHASDPASIKARLVEHLSSPVRFQEQITAMNDAGASVFLEVGPGTVLTGLVSQILGSKAHALSLDIKGRPPITHLLHVLGRLLAEGVDVRLGRLFEGRGLDEAPRSTPPEGRKLWMINGVRSKPVGAPEPLLLGQYRPENQRGSAVAMNGSGSPARPELKESEQMASSHASYTGNGSGSTNGATSSNGDVHATHASPPAAPVAIAPAAAEPLADDAAVVVARFQDLMAKFLETQQSVMLAYLQGGAGAPSPAALTASSPVAMKAPAPSLAELNAYAPPAVPHQPVDAAPVDAPAAPAPITPTQETKAGPTPYDRAKVLDQLQDLVGKRTGYPKEMLGPDMDLEADLGIDSIKRVEILGTLAESLGVADPMNQSSSLPMEKLTSIRTIRGILDYLDETLGKRGSPAPAPESNGLGRHVASENGNGVDHGGNKTAVIQRALVQLVDAPLPEGAAGVAPAGVIVITDDGEGVADALRERFAENGLESVLLTPGSESEDNGQPHVFHADLCDDDSVSAVLDRVRERFGPIGGFAHLAPLGAGSADESAMGRIEREVKSLYLLARRLEEELRAAGSEAGAFFLATTALGGGLGLDEQTLPDEAFAGQGGVIGFTKCVAQEWPEVLVRAVDLDMTLSPNEIAELLAEELTDRRGPVEVGVSADRRATCEPVAAPLSDDGGIGLNLDADSTILITGGARGITAEVALELATRYKPRLVLVGRSPAPPEKESAATMGLDDAASLKSAIMDRRRAAGQSVAPVDVEAEYRQLRAEREIRENLARIKAAGGRVEYRSLDVRDEPALIALIDELDDQGGVDGVIHGAGVIEDKLLKDKSPASFDRVVGTKATGAFALARRLHPERLKFLVFFSSVASRFGNRGQSDYAAANEILAKLAVDLNRRWPARVVSVAWGPWSSIGMVADLEPHLVRRGLTLISPIEGRTRLVDELVRGGKNDVEVIIAGGAERLVRPRESNLAASRASAS